MNTDGNLAALNDYLREQDRLDEYDRQLEEAQGELSDDLFEAYFDNNQAVIDEVNDALDDMQERIFNDLREAFDKGDMRDTYKRLISVACDVIAARTDCFDKVDDYRREFHV